MYSGERFFFFNFWTELKKKKISLKNKLNTLIENLNVKTYSQIAKNLYSCDLNLSLRSREQGVMNYLLFTLNTVAI